MDGGGSAVPSASDARNGAPAGAEGHAPGSHAPPPTELGHIPGAQPDDATRFVSSLKAFLLETQGVILFGTAGWEQPCVGPARDVLSLTQLYRFVALRGGAGAAAQATFDWRSIAAQLNFPPEAAPAIKLTYTQFLSAYMRRYLAPLHMVAAPGAAGRAPGAAAPKRERSQVTGKRSSATAGLPAVRVPDGAAGPKMESGAAGNSNNGTKEPPTELELAKMRKLLGDMTPSLDPSIYASADVETAQGGMGLLQSLVCGVAAERAWALNALMAASSAREAGLAPERMPLLLRGLVSVLKAWLSRTHPSMPLKLPRWLVEGLPEHCPRPKHVDEALANIAGAPDEILGELRNSRLLGDPSFWPEACHALADDPDGLTSARHAAAAAVILSNCALSKEGATCMVKDIQTLSHLAACVEVARWRCSAPGSTGRGADGGGTTTGVPVPEEEDIFSACATALCRLGGLIDLGRPDMLRCVSESADAIKEGVAISSRVLDVMVRQCLDASAPPSLQAQALRALARTATPDMIDREAELEVEAEPPIDRHATGAAAASKVAAEARRAAAHALNPGMDEPLARMCQNNSEVMVTLAPSLVSRSVELARWALAQPGGSAQDAADVISGVAQLLRALCDVGPSGRKAVAGCAAAVRCLAQLLASPLSSAYARLDAAHALDRVAASGAALAALRAVEDELAQAAAYASPALAHPLGRVLIAVAHPH